METDARIRGENRRVFLKKLGGFLLAGTAVRMLPGAAPSTPILPAAESRPVPQTAALSAVDEWNGLSDPGWSG
jgi:hypothetical protein